LLLSIRSKKIWRYLRPVRDRGPNPPKTHMLFTGNGHFILIL